MTDFTDADRVSSVFSIVNGRAAHPDLGRAENQAKMNLVAAIAALDSAPQLDSHGNKMHDLNEQAAANQALELYGQALADLVRGEAGDYCDTE